MIAQIYFHLQICKSLYPLLHYHHKYNYILLLLFTIYLLIISYYESLPQTTPIINQSPYQ